MPIISRTQGVIDKRFYTPIEQLFTWKAETGRKKNLKRKDTHVVAFLKEHMRKRNDHQ